LIFKGFGYIAKKEFAEDGPDPEKTDVVIRDRVSHIFYHKDFFDYPVSLKLQTLMDMGFMDTIYEVFE
jgi:hypothetical protein